MEHRLLKMHVKNISSGQFRYYKPTSRSWDAGWKTFGIVAIAFARRKSVVYGSHFRDGAMPIEESPHFQFAESLLRDRGTRRKPYVRYVSEQYDPDKDQRNLKVANFEKLVFGLEKSLGKISIAVRIQGRKIVIVDGFHRAAIAHALGRPQSIELAVVGPGGTLTPSSANPSPLYTPRDLNPEPTD